MDPLLTTRDGYSRRTYYAQLWGQLKADRASFEAHWKELADFFVPRRTRFWPGDRNRGDKRNQNIIDSTARFAARTLQSGMHAGLTSPARPWFKLTTPDPGLAKQKQVRVWLDEVTQRMSVIFANSNLYTSLPTVYGDMGVFATAAVAVLEDDKDVVRCTAYPVGSYALGLDERGKVGVFAREYELSVLQVVKQFGLQADGRTIDWTNISDTVKNLWDRGQVLSPIPCMWVVTPNELHTPNRLEAKYLPFSSCHYETGDGSGKLLRESGFRQFPVMVPRWDTTGEDAYGTDCPGMTALGDNKQLQFQHRKKAQAIQKIVDPPLKGSPELRTQKTSILSGDITYVRDPKNSLMPVHDMNFPLDALREDMQETQYRIRRAFFEDLFLMLAQRDQYGGDQPPTAREVEERHEEKLLALGPVIERTDDELLDPLVDRVFEIMLRAGLIPDPPEALKGVVLKVEYTSILSQAQKSLGVALQDRFLQSTGALVEVYPSIRYKVNVNKVVDNYADMLGVDPEIVRTDDEANALAAADQQAAKDQADAQTAMLTAKAAKDASDAKVNSGSVLDRMTQGAVAAGGQPPIPGSTVAQPAQPSVSGL